MKQGIWLKETGPQGIQGPQGEAWDGQTPLSELTVTGASTLTGGIKLNSTRIESQELENPALTVSGWYTFAELAAEGGNSAVASFTVASLSSLFTLDASIRTRNLPRNKDNSALKIKSKSFNSTPEEITAFRIAKSDNTNSTGAKLQFYLAATGTVKTQISNNTGLSKGWELIEPYLDDTPTLPDGITTATFIEEKEVSGTQRVLWTGPLSVISVPTTLNAGESFSDWDRIVLYVSLESATTSTTGTTLEANPLYLDAKRIYSDIGNIRFRKLTDTTFEVDLASVSPWNIQRIEGVKL
jgi:hypothetical protein